MSVLHTYLDPILASILTMAFMFLLYDAIANRIIRNDWWRFIIVLGLFMMTALLHYTAVAHVEYQVVNNTLRMYVAENPTGHFYIIPVIVGIATLIIQLVAMSYRMTTKTVRVLVE